MFLRIVTILFVLSVLPGAVHAAQPIAGRFVTQNRKAVVAIEPCGRAMCGRIVKLLPAADSGITSDIRNSDAGLRSRPLIGVPILLDFTDSGADWRGRIYSPEEGQTYSSLIVRNPDGSLKVKGCLMFFCKTQTWPRAE